MYRSLSASLKHVLIVPACAKLSLRIAAVPSLPNTTNLKNGVFTAARH